MKSRPEANQSIPVTANAKKVFALCHGEELEEDNICLDVDDIRSINQCEHPYYNHFFDLILNALRNHKIKSNTQIELTEHAAGMTFAGLDELEKYLLQRGFPEGFKIFINVDEQTHPMVRNKALRLERMFSYSDPCMRLINYLKQPVSETTLYISDAMRTQYQANTQHDLIEDLCELISSGRLAPFTKILFEGNSFFTEAEAKKLSACIICSNPPAGFHVYIPTSGKDKKDITLYQAKTWDFLEARQNADKALAMSLFLSGGQFSHKFIHDVFVDKGIAGKIYHYVDDQLEDTYTKAAALQHERVSERLISRKRWGLFKATAIVVGSLAAVVGAATFLKQSK